MILILTQLFNPDLVFLPRQAFLKELNNRSETPIADMVVKVNSLDDSKPKKRFLGIF
jgi:hypothetical protein